ncbi:MAG: DUF309 domain-containing protein, partial [Campylobacterota bacterium]|nr:DUF309 domain-containing protein [Campylobacterota bacterium]
GKPMKEILDSYIHLIENHEFAKAHECLEENWKAFRTQGKKDESNILKGFINAASAFELKRLGRESASKIWQAYLKYRVLIDEVDSLHVAQYQECARCVEAKYKEIFEV